MTQADDELVLRECRRAGVADLDGDDIGRGDQALAHEEADGELFVVAARAHGDGDVGRDLARAGDADRQRLLARQQILARVGPARADRHDPAGRARAIGTVASFGARRHGASVSRTVARVAATRPPARTRAAREAPAGRSAGPRSGRGRRHTAPSHTTGRAGPHPAVRQCSRRRRVRSLIATRPRSAQ